MASKGRRRRRSRRWVLRIGDCLDVMRTMQGSSVDSVVTDPPYGLEFMGKAWDRALPDVEVWSEALRVAKPGAHLVAFGAPRLYHRLACQIEDAGWGLRDCLMWIFGSGFPKSLDVSKAIDKAAGAEREVVGTRAVTRITEGSGGLGEVSGLVRAGVIPITAPATPDVTRWTGWGTALKPAYEPIILARKPLCGTVAANVLAHGTGAINVDACRVGTDSTRRPLGSVSLRGTDAGDAIGGSDAGRWPANLILDEKAGAMLDEQSGKLVSHAGNVMPHHVGMGYGGGNGSMRKIEGSGGGASRFFYCVKASRSERTHGGVVENKHPTVKPLALMRWLVRLVTPPGGTVLDPFMGSGSTGLSAVGEQFRFIGIDSDPESVAIAEARKRAITPKEAAHG